MYWPEEKCFNINVYAMRATIAFILITLLGACKEKPKKTNAAVDTTVSNTIRFVQNEKEHKVAVYFGDSFFTNYLYKPTQTKPVLHPIQTRNGKTVTRGYPLDPKPGERVDHPHHVGHWLNYGDVNGLDFWNHSDAIPEEEKHRYGSIYHQNLIIDQFNGSLLVSSLWKDHSGNALIKENTTFLFSEEGNHRFIDRITSLEALTEVVLTDNKEGFFAIRVSRALEHPTDKAEIFTDANGIPATVKALDNTGVTGSYLSSEGIEGKAVWGTRARWMSLRGSIQEKPLSITIFDHPENIGYPTFWHARGYGLFAANPLGQKVFSNGKLALNKTLNEGEILTVKYRMMIHHGTELTSSDIEKYATTF